MTETHLQSGVERIGTAIRGAAEARRMAVAAFLTAGYPEPADYRRLLETVAAEADIVEVGVPFSDPMADGITIQRSSHVAIERGVTLDWVLETVSSAPLAAPPVLMSYLNPLLAFGIDRLAERATAAGIVGFIVPDLPLEESETIDRSLDRNGLALIHLVSPVTPEDRLRRIAQRSRGFLYAVTVAGITGADVASDVAVTEYLDRVRACSPVPVLAGFGIRRPHQVHALAGHADGVVVGSALIEAIDRGEDPAAVVASLRIPLGAEMDGS